MAVVFKEIVGGNKQWDTESGTFQFDGTTLTGECPVRKLGVIAQSNFTIVPGTAGLSNYEQVYIQEEAIGTSATGVQAELYGGVVVSGTSVTLGRLVKNGTALAAGASSLWVQYEFRGPAK